MLYDDPYGAITLSGTPFQADFRYHRYTLLYRSVLTPQLVTPKNGVKIKAWAFPASLAATKGISVDFFSSPY